MGSATKQALAKGSGRLYRASEFARLTGVTVRALHHYDREGLLKPSGRTAAGHRFYGERDFARLQQVVTLKFLGFPLNQIKEILNRDGFDLARAIRAQRQLIAEKRRQLDLAVKALAHVEGVLATGQEPDWESFAKIVEAINMQNNNEWMNQYYSEEARQAIDERAKNWTPEMLEQAQRDWATLIKEVQAAIGEGVDPASERALALAMRWRDLVNGFTGGNPAIVEGIKKLYADRANWPANAKKPYSDEAAEFIGSVVAARQKQA